MTLPRPFIEPTEAEYKALPEQFRAVLFAYEHRMDYRQIAEQLSIPIGTVRSRLHRAKERVFKLREAQREYSA